MSRKLYALLVGINEHHPESVKVKNLKGCQNDVEAIQRLLKKQYASLSPNIKILLNEQATRKNIIQNFREHLTTNAGQNSTILFYFSGHGSRQSMPKAFQRYVAGISKKMRREETLVCYDSRVCIDEKWLEEDLADKELAILIEEAAEKKAHIVVILDCCHSGSGTRAGKPMPGEQAQIREIEERVVADALHRNYLGHYYEKMLETEGKITLPNSCHILLAGTQKDNVSWEYTLDGKRRGLFTYHIEQALLANPHLSYADLFSLVGPRVVRSTEKKARCQRPQFETYHFFDAHSHFLTGATLPGNRRLYGIKMVRGEWRIEQGEVHGLASAETTPLIEWGIYEAPGDDTPLALAKTTRVAMNYNTVEVVEGDLNPEQNYLAELRSMPAQRLVVGINTNPPAELASPLVQLVNDASAQVQLVINKAQDVYTLARDDEELLSKKYGPVALTSTLERIARWHRILESHNAQPTQLSYEDFLLSFSVSGKNAPAKTLFDSQGILELTSEKGQYFDDAESEWIIPYEMTGQNLSDYDVYFTLLHLDPYYGIEVYYNQLVPAQTNEIILAEGYGLFPEKFRQPTADRFKLIVSTRELSSYLFSQPDIQEGQPKKTKRTDQTIPNDWLAKVLEVETIKKEN